MNPTRTGRHTAAGRLLDSHGDTAARRGSPVWLLVRSLDTGSSEAGGPAAGRLDTCEVGEPEGLLGQVVGPGWEAVAVVGTGRFRLLDQSHEPPAALIPGLAGGLAMACLVTREGEVGWRMRLPDGTYYDRVPESGFMLDVLRRCLRLPTAPPETSVAPLELAAWVATLVSVSEDQGRRLDWPEALALHPATAGEGLSPARPGQLEARILSSVTTEGWEAMRRMVAAGLHADLAPPPRLAAWMDEGMFSRWLLRDVPGLDCLLAACRPHLYPGAYGRLCHLARSLDDRT